MKPRGTWFTIQTVRGEQARIDRQNDDLAPHDAADRPGIAVREPVEAAIEAAGKTAPSRASGLRGGSWLVRLQQNRRQRRR